MRRRWMWIIAVSGTLLVGGSYLVWSYRQVQTTGQAVFHEIEGDGLPVPEGVLDDPVFADLPPAGRPVSLGRYKPPPGAAEPGPAREEPTPAPEAADELSTAPPVPARPDPESAAPQRPVEPPAPESALPEPPSEPAVVTGSEVQQPPPPPPISAEAEPPVTAPVSQKPTSQESASQEPAVRTPVQAPVPMSPAKAQPTPAYWPASFSDRLRTQARLHLLLVGTDQQELGSGRGDVLMVLTFDPVSRRLLLTSIPRDTQVTLPGQGTVKINAAYARGGIEQQTLAVERFLGLPMDKYVEISLSGFRRAIDRVGGVDIESRLSFSVGDDVFMPGPMHLTGAQAESYTRMRKEDPRGDLGRNDRQQQVIRALIQALSQKSVPELQALTAQLRADLRTNLTPTEAVQLRAAHGYAFDHLAQVQVQGVGRQVGGVWYYLVSDAERRRLHLTLR